MDIYIIRHGETDYNVERRTQGMWGESHLTEHGIAQAKAARALVANLSFDRIHVSAADRTRQTAALLFPDREDFLFSDDLREMHTGILTNHLIAESRQKYADIYPTISQTEGFAAFGGESCEEITARAKNAAARILAEGGETIAVITHGTFIRYLVEAFTDISHRHLVIVENCAVSLVTVTDDKKRLSFYNRVAYTSEQAGEAI